MSLYRSYREHNPAAVGAEVKGKTQGITTQLFVKTDPLFVARTVFTVDSNGRIVTEASVAFASATRSMTIEIMAVTRVPIWHSWHFERRREHVMENSV